MNIKELIKNNANALSMKKGKTIFNYNQVLKFVSLDNEKYVAEVKGSVRVPYQLHFSITDEKQLVSYCSCPYDWGGICKHLVAALYYLDEHQEGEITTKPKSIKKNNKRDPTTPYEMAISEMDSILGLISNEARYKIQRIGDVGMDDDKITIVVPPDYYYDDSIVVYIKPNKERLLISSNSSRRVNGLSEYEQAALFYLKQENLTYLFDLFDEQKINQLILNKAKEYGIDDIEKAQEFFEVRLGDEEGPIQLKKEHENLLPISGFRKDFLFFTKKITGGDVYQEDWLLARSKKKKEKSPLVVRFALQTEVVFRDHEIITLLPFVCKIKPDGTFFKSNLEALSRVNSWGDVRPELNDLERELVSFSEKFNAESFKEALKTTYNKLEGEQQRVLVLEQNLTFLRDYLPRMQGVENLFALGQKENHYYGYSLDPSDFRPVTLTEEKPEPILDVETKDGFIYLIPKLKFSFGTYKWSSKKIKFQNNILGTIDDKVFLMKSVESAIVLHSAFSTSSEFKVLEGNFHNVFNDIIRPLSQYMTINFKQLPTEIQEEMDMTEITAKKVYLKELDQFILIKPIVEYGFESINILEDQPTVRLEGNTIVQLNRQKEEEQSFLDTIFALHPDFNKKKNQGFCHLHIDDFVKDYWFLSFSDQLKDLGIEVYGFNEFKNFQYSPYRPSIKVQVSSGEDWFDVDIEVLVGDTRIGLKDLKKVLISKEKYIKLGDGKLAVLPKEWVDKLQRYLRMGKVNKDGLKISKLKFNAVDELFEDIDNDEVLDEIRQKRNKLQEFSSITKVTLPRVTATLRDYQKDGYRWLHFLHEFGWGGILADDMGLGKTLQIITFLRFLKSNKVNNNLIIVPTTLLFNWKVEIEKFCPSLKFYVHHGTDRDKEKIDWKKYDVVITTYGLIISDIKLFSKQKYGYVILDESQAIKNPSSKRFKAVNVLKAYNRLALTGTPIENSTFDLYAQMSFVNPGLFASADGFRKEYALPIDKNGDKQAAAELHKIIHPFVLRRTKEMVAKELPPKIEDVIYCNMDTAQRKVYDAHRNEYRNDILNLIEEDGLEKSKMHVLQALTKLRQVCNSPALLKGEESYADEAVKIKELIRHIQEKTGNHKLLIFSQFVKMLQLIKNELENLDIDYSYLDGQTTQKNRRKAVDDFQENKNIRVFLISLKAGGTGINLTAADYVYIVDPWWNPAVENQAIDRCYRIGQNKKVIAYRMICKDTIEEKIMNYKSRKQIVADSIIQTDENIMKQISKDDILDLFG